MTEVSSTRLYLGNLPRNGMLATHTSYPYSLSPGSCLWALEPPQAPWPPLWQHMEQTPRFDL